MPANIEMKKQGNLYVPSEISDYCNGVVPYQRAIDRRDFLKKTGSFLGTVFGAWVGYKTIDNILGNEAFGQELASADFQPNLSFQYGPATRNRKHSDKPAEGDSYFWDIDIINGDNIGYLIEKIDAITPHNKSEISGDTIQKYCGSNYIPPKGKLTQTDRRASIWGKGATWPIFVEDIYSLKSDNGKRIQISSKRKVP